MAFRRMFLYSVLLGFGAGLAAYVLAWGFFSTHAELGMDPGGARIIAAWTGPAVFVGSLLYFFLRKSRS